MKLSRERRASSPDVCPGQISWDYDRAEIIADGAVHAIGVCLGLIGAVTIVVIAVRMERIVAHARAAPSSHSNNLATCAIPAAVAVEWIFESTLLGGRLLCLSQGRNAMNQLSTLILATVALLCALSAGDVFGQTAKDFVGFWTIVSADRVHPDGSIGAPAFGPNPRGFLVFDSGGRYALQIISASLPKFGSNNRMQGTPEENKAVVQGMVAHFGKYSVNEADLTFTFHIEKGLFPNWDGTDRRLPFTITGDQLKYSLVTSSGGGSVEAVWTRAK